VFWILHDRHEQNEKESRRERRGLLERHRLCKYYASTRDDISHESVAQILNI
jgi:hypothetical protein